MTHRFRELLDAPQYPAAAPAVGSAAFVPCPTPVLAGFSPAHQAFVADVYRAARELTEAQHAPARRPQPVLPGFSLN